VDRVSILSLPSQLRERKWEDEEEPEERTAACLPLEGLKPNCFALCYIKDPTRLQQQNSAAATAEHIFIPYEAPWNFLPLTPAVTAPAATHSREHSCDVPQLKSHCMAGARCEANSPTKPCGTARCVLQLPQPSRERNREP